MNKRHNIFRILAGSLGLLFVLSVLLFFSAVGLINSETAKTKIHTFLLEKTGAEVTYNNFKLHLFPVPEIIFHQVKIAISDKAKGSVTALRAYPDIWSLMKGRTGIEKINLEAPHFSVRISTDEEKTNLKEIEEKVRSVVQTVVSKTPGLILTIQDGRLDLTKSGEIAFSFEMIRSRFSATQKKLEIELACRSNLWDNLSVSSSIEADDLKSGGTVRITHLRPDILLARLSKKTAELIEASDAGLSVKFEAVGLSVVKASMESSVAGLAITRDKRRLFLGDGSLQGDISVRPDAATVRIKEAKISQPSLSLSGHYTLDRDSGIMKVGLEAGTIAVQPLRRFALAIGGDIPLIKAIFSYVQGGQIDAFSLHSDGNSLDELGSTVKIGISGKMTNGTIYVAAKDLTFHNVIGDVVISRGILEAGNIAASIGNHQCSGGRLRVGLKGDDAPLHLDVRVKADLKELPSLLSQKQLVRNEPVLHEMDRLYGLRGNVEGRLIIGERLDEPHVKIAIDAMNFMTLYEPLPFPLTVKGGNLFFDEKILKVTDLEGSIGRSSFSGLTGSLGMDSPYDLQIAGGRFSVSANEIYPWITSFETIRPALDAVPSVKGEVEISSIDLWGPLYETEKWKYHAVGQVRALTLEAAFLPGKAEEMNGTFGITQDELSLKEIRARLIDSLITVSGVISPFPSDVRKINMSLKGDIGPKVNSWIAGLVNLPPEVKIRAPYTVWEASFSLEKDIKTEFSGGLLFGAGTQVSLSVTNTAYTTAIRGLTVKDSSSDLAADILIGKKAIDATFRGRVTAGTIDTIFEESMFSGASLEGDFSTHLVIANPEQTRAEGSLKANHIAVPWGWDVPLLVQHIELEAKEQAVVINSAELMAGDMKFRAKGVVSMMPLWFSVDMDVSSDGIEWVTAEKIIEGEARASTKNEAGFLNDIPVKGTLRLRSDFFQYRHLRWEPFYADGSFDGKTLLITVKEAELCGISTTGTLGISEPGVKLNVALSAHDRAFRPTIVCLTDANADFTGIFEMEARMKGEGKIDDVLNWLEGAFTLSAKDGQILKSQEINKTLHLLNESENFKGEFPDLDRKMISYKAVKMRGTVGEHKLQIEEAMLDSSVIGITAHGYLDLRKETMDVHALVAPLKMVHKIVRMIPVLGYVLGGVVLSVPVRLSGDIKDPQVTFLSPTAIGSEALRIMTRTLKLPIKLVEPVFPAKKEKD